MQEAPEDFSDERLKAWCIHCGKAIVGLTTNMDHAPTESLLDDPPPENLPKVLTCKPCNGGFSKDEEYFRTVLSCVLAGSTAPEDQVDSRVGRALARSPALRARIEAAKREQTDLFGATSLVWFPEMDRVERVVVKNARGHAYYELGEPMLDEPGQVWVKPLQLMTAEERAHFERIDMRVWAEVGSRMMHRQALLATGLIAGGDMEDGWVTVQDNVYRYAVAQDGAITVRSVIRNYLATEVHWD